MAQGKMVLGGVVSQKWMLHCPHLSTNQRAKVMTYVRVHDCNHPFHLNYCKGIVRMDLCAHPTIIIMDIVVDTYYWHTINFYNNVDDLSSLRTLMNLDLDSTIPTILLGDFNLHSHSWSLRDWAPTLNVDRVEEWLATQTFSLLSTPHIPRHCSKNGA